MAKVTNAFAIQDVWSETGSSSGYTWRNTANINASSLDRIYANPTDCSEITTQLNDNADWKPIAKIKRKNQVSMGR